MVVLTFTNNFTLDTEWSSMAAHTHSSYQMVKSLLDRCLDNESVPRQSHINTHIHQFKSLSSSVILKYNQMESAQAAEQMILWQKKI